MRMRVQFSRLFSAITPNETWTHHDVASELLTGCRHEAAQASREVSDHRSRVRQNQIALLAFLKPWVSRPTGCQEVLSQPSSKSAKLPEGSPARPGHGRTEVTGHQPLRGDGVLISAQTFRHQVHPPGLGCGSLRAQRAAARDDLERVQASLILGKERPVHAPDEVVALNGPAYFTVVGPIGRARGFRAPRLEPWCNLLDVRRCVWVQRLDVAQYGRATYLGLVVWLFHTLVVDEGQHPHRGDRSGLRTLPALSGRLQEGIAWSAKSQRGHGVVSVYAPRFQNR